MDNETVPGFRIGDAVEWESQSGSYRKKKKGVIFDVVPAGGAPDPKELRVLGAGFGMNRDHKSYLVRVGNIAYWPRVKHLRLQQ